MGQTPHVRRRRVWRLFVGLAILAMVAAACGSDSEPSGSTQAGTVPVDSDLVPQTGGKAIIGIDAESDGYSPLTNRFAQSGHLVASAIFDPLATIDDEGNAVPYFAESITPNDDFTVWTITLPSGVKFHNDDPVTAQGVAEVLEAHRTGLVTSSLMTPIVSIEAIDDTTVEVTSSQPWVNFPTMLTTQAGYVMAPSMLSDPDGAANPVGTGPFILDEWDRGNSLTAIRNDNYWRTDEDGGALPYLDAIEFVVYTDAEARLQALESGDVDLMFTLTPQSIKDLRATSIPAQYYDRGDEDVVTLNTEAPPFDNLDARLALAYATDQDAFLEQIQLGEYAPASGPFAPEQLGYREDNGYPEYDPEEAKARLAAYTEATGEETLQFVYSAADDVDNLAAAQFLVDMWADVGIEATVDAVPQATIIFQNVTGNYQAADWRNWANPDPDTDYVWWHSTSVRPPSEGISVNVSRLGTPEIDAFLDDARASEDDTFRDEQYAGVAAAFGEQVPYIWLGRVGWAIAGDERIHGWQVATENGTVATVGATTWVQDLWLS